MNDSARRDGTPDRDGAPNSATPDAATPEERQGRAKKRPNKKVAAAAYSKRTESRKPGVSGYPRLAPKKSGSKPGKSPKPERKSASSPTVSNAKPARHQHTDGPRPHVAPEDGVRLQKVLAQAGVASRRAAEQLIDEGRVEVDGRIVTEQGVRVDPEVAVVRVDGTRVVIKADLVHIALNKPRGWQSTMSDDLGRPCIGDIVSERVQAGQRLFHVGRLDADTEGLILLTNDGDLAHRLMHPSFEVSKTYLATVHGVLDRDAGKKLRSGVDLDDGPASVDSYAVLDINEGMTLVKVVLHEGRKHIVRRLFDSVGFPVRRLVRTDIGAVALGDQRPGTLRVLGRGEVGSLYGAVGL